MKITPAAIADVLIIEPRVFGDDRGFFYESFSQREFNRGVGLDLQFVQDNYSHSKQGVLRGLHYQIRQPQGKLVRVVRGAIFDVAVDLRKGSATFGKWVGSVLTEHNHLMSWMPAGFAHGFLVISEFADVLYKTTDYYAPEHERCIQWNDPDLAIAWPSNILPHLSVKDSSAPPLHSCELPR